MKTWQTTNIPDITVVSDPGLDDLLALALLDRLLPTAAKTLVATYGNMPAGATAQNARDFASVSEGSWQCRTGATRPLKGGANGPWIDGKQGNNGLWDIRPESGTSSSVLATGPTTPQQIISLATFTDIKQLLQAGGIKQLLIMGGLFDRLTENGNPAELNVRMDADAASWVFENCGNIETTVVPAEVAFDVSWSRSTVESIPETSPLNRWLKRLLLAGYDNGRYKTGNELYDPLAVFLAFYPEYAGWRESGIRVTTDRPVRGMTLLDDQNPVCTIATKVRDPQAVADSLFQAIFEGRLP